MITTSRTEHFILNQIGSAIAPNDTLLHFAYLAPVMSRSARRSAARAFSWASKASAYLAAIGTSHVYLIRTRVGAFSPLLENRGLLVVPSQDYDLQPTPDGTLILCVRMNGSVVLELEVDCRPCRQVPSQLGFLRVLARYKRVDLRALRAKRARVLLIPTIAKWLLILLIPVLVFLVLLSIFYAV